MIEKFFNERGDEVGWGDGVTYHTDRNAKRGQIFLHPKYLGGLALSISILKKLVKKDYKFLEFRIINWEDRTFFCEISLKKFLEKSREIQFDKYRHRLRYGKQRFLHQNEFIRRYPEQKRLTTILPSIAKTK